jgi:hypothetical protein
LLCEGRYGGVFAVAHPTQTGRGHLLDEWRGSQAVVAELCARQPHKPIRAVQIGKRLLKSLNFEAMR